MKTNTVTQLRKLAEDPENEFLFGVLATKGKNKTILSMTDIMSWVKNRLTRNEVVKFWRTLDQLALCNFIVGRRTNPSRVRFFYAPASIGEVALGESDTLQPVKMTDVIPELTKIVPPILDSTAPIVQDTPFGTLFMLPKGATVRDKNRLATIIRQMTLKQQSA